MVYLKISRLYMPFVHCPLLNFIGPGINTSPSAIVANSVIHHCCIIDNRAVNIYIMDHVSVYMCYGSIIPEASSFPDSANISCPRISPTVIYSSIKSNVRTPIAPVPVICSVIETPVRRGPEPTYLGWKNPYTWDPVISHFGIVGPIAWHPEPAFHLTGWLIINWQRRGWNNSTY
jgi:hypothetical protein